MWRMRGGGVRLILLLAVFTIFGIGIILQGQTSKYLYEPCIDNISASLKKFFSFEASTHPDITTLPPLLRNWTLKNYERGHSSNGKLLSSVRVLCWVMTQPANHDRVKAITDTWGKRCNKLIFISSEEDASLGIVGLNITEGRNQLWGKTKQAFKYVAKHHINDSSWFLKADDDTYIIMENLRNLLRPYNASHPLWFGHRFKKFSKQGYMSGGAGYVLSREALRKFVEEAIPDTKKCRGSNDGAEDAEIGKCLDKVGVIAMDSRDERNRGRFFPMAPDNHLTPNFIGPTHWYWNYTFYKDKLGMECCSDTLISFHYIPAVKMVELEYFIYHLKVVDSK